MRPDQQYGESSTQQVEDEFCTYDIKVYTDHGYFQYTVNDIESAMNHGQTIMKSGVFRHYSEGAVIFYPVLKVKVVGPGLNTQYPAEFKRT